MIHGNVHELSAVSEKVSLIVACRVEARKLITDRARCLVLDDSLKKEWLYSMLRSGEYEGSRKAR